MKYFRAALFTVGLAALTGCATQKFTHHESFPVVGEDGRTYSIQILWNDLASIPGDHAIRAVTTDSHNRSHVQDFRSGNRAALYAVSLLHESGHDKVLFRVACFYASGFTYTNTVDATGLHGYPELVRRFEEHRRFYDAILGPQQTAPTPKTAEMPKRFPPLIYYTNDNATIAPLTYTNKEGGVIYHVESDGRHVSASTADGKLLWRRNPFVDAQMEPYRWTKPVISQIGAARDLGFTGDPDVIWIRFNSSQVGWIDPRAGDFRFVLQD